MIRPRAVIFDYGNVLCLPQPSADLDAMAQRIGAPRQQFENLYWRFRDPYDRGEIDAATYWKRIAGLPLPPGHVDELVSADNRSWMHPNREMIDWAETLKRSGLKLGLLSNMHLDLRADLANHCAWLPIFDHVTFSCDVGCIKPEEEIYRHCLRGLGVNAKEALFIDDREPNIEGARKVGIHGLLFEDARRASREAAVTYCLPEIVLG